MNDQDFEDQQDQSSDSQDDRLKDIIADFNVQNLNALLLATLDAADPDYNSAKPRQRDQLAEDEAAQRFLPDEVDAFIHSLGLGNGSPKKKHLDTVPRSQITAKTPTTSPRPGVVIDKHQPRPPEPPTTSPKSSPAVSGFDPQSSLGRPSVVPESIFAAPEPERLPIPRNAGLLVAGVVGILLLVLVAIL